MINTTIAHYKVTAKLGQGGMGEVYRESRIKNLLNPLDYPQRWNLRQVLECGNEVAALGLQSSRLNQCAVQNFKHHRRKAVSRCARTALQDLCVTHIFSFT